MELTFARSHTSPTWSTDLHLILFDIDGTLVTACGLGLKAVKQAGQTLFGTGFTVEGVQYAGRIDPLIFQDILTHNQLAPDNFEPLINQYHETLTSFLQQPGVIDALPGVRTLVKSLSAMDHVVTGLLTGNTPLAGHTKLQACDLDINDFPISVWGIDSPHYPPHRDHLPPVAIERCIQQDRIGSSFQTTIIGDTPSDVQCASVNQCRSLAVATGYYSQEDLSHADRVVGDLSDNDGIISWLTGTQ